MAYIDFGTSPVKTGTIKPKYTCENCLHNIFVLGGVCRCTITNNYMFYNQKFDTECKFKDKSKDVRIILAGLFTYDKHGNTIWTGILTCYTARGLNDEKCFNEVWKVAKDDIHNQPTLKDKYLFYCVVAECIDNKNFINKTTLIEKELFNNIIEDANKKFL